MAAMGLSGPAELSPRMLMRRLDHVRTSSYAELYGWLEPGELLADPRPGWAADWASADPDRFGI
jgi:hypothetical protein